MKLIFMRLQHFKCVFCERPLAGETAGSAEHDLEHFRPKGSVKAGPKRGAGHPEYDFATGDASGTGYFWLAYDLENYAAACKPCNTARKSNAFPVAGARGAAGDSVTALAASEQPLLLFPLGQTDVDPEQIITFEGIVAVPVAATGLANRRARVTIDFLALNDREELWEDRFRTIRTVFQSMETCLIHPDPARREAARRAIDEAVSDAGPQASCARSFLKKMTSDAAQAWAIYQAAEEFVRKKRRG